MTTHPTTTNVITTHRRPRKRAGWLRLLAAMVACAVCGLGSWQVAEGQLHRHAISHLACENIAVEDVALHWSYRTVELVSVHSHEDTAKIASVLATGASDQECLERVGARAGRPIGTRAVAIDAAG